MKLLGDYYRGKHISLDDERDSAVKEVEDHQKDDFIGMIIICYLSFNILYYFVNQLLVISRVEIVWCLGLSQEWPE